MVAALTARKLTVTVNFTCGRERLGLFFQDWSPDLCLVAPPRIARRRRCAVQCHFTARLVERRRSRDPRITKVRPPSRTISISPFLASL
jgi:hypothetical protein